MELKSFGCSFIHGTDLADAKGNHPSQSTWPALIAKNLGWNYCCHARGGVGNLQILETVLKHVEKEPAFFVIGWTWIDRFDYTTTDDQWRSILPNDLGEIPDYFYRNLHSQYRDKITSLIHIKLAIDALSEHGHQFVMTYMDTLLFETEWHASPATIYLQSKVRPHMQNFQGKTFLDWSRDHDFEISDRWHPLETAHAAAADHVLSNWKEFKQMELI